FPCGEHASETTGPIGILGIQGVSIIGSRVNATRGSRRVYRDLRPIAQLRKNAGKRLLGTAVNLEPHRSRMVAVDYRRTRTDRDRPSQIHLGAQIYMVPSFRLRSIDQPGAIGLILHIHEDVEAGTLAQETRFDSICFEHGLQRLATSVVVIELVL